MNNKLPYYFDTKYKPLSYKLFLRKLVAEEQGKH